MISQQPTQASGVRDPTRLEGWKVVIAIGTAITLGPVLALVLFFVLAAALPVLPLLAALFAGVWLRAPHPPPASASGQSPLSVTRPIASLPSSFRNA
jgi:hypothetical protein